jgi:hypothetical protein
MVCCGSGNWIRDFWWYVAAEGEYAFFPISLAKFDSGWKNDGAKKQQKQKIPGSRAVGAVCTANAIYE